MVLSYIKRLIGNKVSFSINVGLSMQNKVNIEIHTEFHCKQDRLNIT